MPSRLPLRLGALLLCATPAAYAADMTLTPAAGGAVVIESAPNSPALQVGPSGDVRLPGLPATPAAGTGVVCHDAAGTLGRCSPLTAVGPKGDQGVKGDTGATGAAGPQGAAGPAGHIGPAGPKGDAGVPGAAGATGPQGAQGPQCPQGPQGPTGAAGASGLQGAPGPQGPQGPKGDTGPTGPQGALAGVSAVRHGCFTVNDAGFNPFAPASLVSGSGYNVNPAISPNGATKRAYFIFFNTPPGGLNSTVLLDVRAITGRSLPATVQRGTPIDLLLEVDLGNGFMPNEGISVCFMLMR